MIYVAALSGVKFNIQASITGHLQGLVELEVSKNSFHLKIISHVQTEASLKNTSADLLSL